MIKDSGKEHRKFNTGSVRDNAEGKGRPSLMPLLALEEVSKTFEAGAAKYQERNWEKGQPLSSYMDSLTRHMHKFFGGATDENHASQMAWNALCMLETHLRVQKGLLPEELDDRPETIYPELNE